MANCLDYARNANEPVRGTNFVAADAVILCLLSYLHFGFLDKSTVLSDLRGDFEKATNGTRVPELNKELLLACGDSRRFANIRVVRFAEDTDLGQIKQFAAVTFFIDWETIFVAFRGTDGTIVGWQEDFDLAFMDEIPAQGQAKEYLQRVLKEYWWCRVIVGGHSKGGNLGVYAGMTQNDAETSRILAIYDLDGPGFKKEVDENLETQPSFSKVIKIVPEYSVIGMLLEQKRAPKVIQSNGNWLYQHDLFNWRMDASTGAFSYISTINPDASNINRAVFHWLDNIDEDKRAVITESLFSIMKEATDCTTVSCVIETWKSHVIRLIMQYHKEDKQSRILLRKDLFLLAKDLIIASHQNRDKDDHEKKRRHRGG